MKPTTLRTALLWTALAAGALALWGCAEASPDVTATPHYLSAGSPPATAPSATPIALHVTDARQEKQPPPINGKEVLAEGDKGRVMLDRPLLAAVQDGLQSGFQSAGYAIKPDAPVVVDVELRQFPLQAWQFTNWGLPSERASTVDAVGVLLPGPVRETKAKTVLSVVIRKHDTRMGYSYYIETDAENKSPDRAVVEQTIDQSLSKAIDQAVRDVSKDIEAVSRAPVTKAEFDDRSQALASQKETIDALRKEIGDRDAVLAGARKALADSQQALNGEHARLAMERERFAKDRQRLDDDLAGVKDALRSAKEEMTRLQGDTAQDAAAREQLARRQKELEQRQQELAQRQQSLTQREIDLGKLNDQLAAREKAAAGKEQNVAARAADLDKLAAANRQEDQDLRGRVADLDRREQDLRAWQATVLAKANTKPPAGVVIPIEPQVVLASPEPGKQETTLPALTVSGVAFAGERIDMLRATVNGQEVKLPATTAEPEKGKRPAYLPFTFTIPLHEGENQVAIQVTDARKISAGKFLSMTYKPTVGRIFVIAIGINKYDVMDPLSAAVPDAQSVAQVLTQSLRGNANVQVLLDRQATYHALVDELPKGLAAEAKQGDTVIVFFSGRGLPDVKAGGASRMDLLMLPVDADPSELGTTTVPVGDLGKLFAALRSERVVFLVNAYSPGAQPQASHSGGLAVGRVTRRSAGQQPIVITAADPIQPNSEKPNLDDRVFVNYLVKGLGGEADVNHDGKVTVAELYAYLRSKVGETTGGKQMPELLPDTAKGALASEIVLNYVH